MLIEYYATTYTMKIPSLKGELGKVFKLFEEELKEPYYIDHYHLN